MVWQLFILRWWTEDECEGEEEKDEKEQDDENEKEVNGRVQARNGISQNVQDTVKRLFLR